MAKSVINQFAGLVTAGNSTSLPPGALRRAQGVVIRLGRIEHRRPHKTYVAAAAHGAAVTGLAYYGDTLFTTTATQMRKDNGAGVLSLLTGTLSAPPGSFNYFMEASGNLYLTSGNGVKKLESTSSAILPSGVPRALDLALSSATGTTVFSATGQVAAYRVCYGIQDANTNLIVGPPSGRATFTSTAAQDVTVRSDIPKEIWNATNATSYFYRVFRTSVNTAGADPGDECQLVYQAKLTATDVANKFISVTDRQPDSALQDYLYTNPSQEKIAQANYAPPICQDLALFAGCGFYANTTSKHRSRLVMLGIPEEMAIQSIAANTPIVGRSTYTFAAPVDTTGLTTAMFLSVTGSTAAANDGTWQVVSSTGTTVVVQNAGVNQAAPAGTAITGLIAVDGTSYFPVYTAESSANKQFTVPTTGTQSQRIASTALSLCRMINRQHGTVYAYYESGPQDGPGRILFEEQSIGGASFNVTAASTTTAAYANAYYNRFAPTIASGTPLTSSNDRAKNRLYVSKYSQQEHVPLGDTNYFDIGAKTAAIQRITPLREALLIWKDDGLFRLTGTAGGFSLGKFDETIQIASDKSVAVMRNKAYALCGRGCVEADAVSAKLISKPVSNIAVTFTSSASNVVSTSERDGFAYFGVGSPEATTLIYNVENGTWSGDDFATSLYGSAWVYAARLGVVYRSSRAGSWDTVAVENYADSTLTLPIMHDVIDPGDALPVTVTASSSVNKTITITPALSTSLDITNFVYTVRSNALGVPTYWKITAMDGTGAILTLAPLKSTYSFSFPNGLYDLFIPIVVDVEFHPKSAGNDPSTPQMLDGVTFCFENTTEREYSYILGTQEYPSISAANVSFRAEFSSTYYTQSALPVSAALLDVEPPRDVADTRFVVCRLQHSVACERLSIGSVVFDWATELDSTANQ